MNEIKIAGLTKTYKGVPALDGASLTFQEGKIYGLLGRNGAGKSTLINVVCNRVFAQEGSVEIDGESAVDNSSAQSKLFCMSEQNMYPESHKISDIFQWTARFQEAFDLEKAKKYAAAFELDLKKKVKALSTGYRSIFKLVIALSMNLPYIFFDEPVLGLDANHRELFYKLLIQEYEENPRTFIIATHLIEEVAGLVEDVIIINKGKVLVQTTVEELLHSGFSVSGSADDVDTWCKGKNVIGEDRLGALKVAYVLGKTEEKLPSGLQISSINLQKLFVKLTESEGAA